MAEEADGRGKEAETEAAKTAGVSMRPSDTTAVDEAAAKFGTAQVDYIYEQPPEELFRGMLPKYIGIQIFHALLESVAAEHAARMTAMDAATSNASDMIDSLTLDHEPGAPGQDHQRDYRNRKRSSSTASGY
jgi:F-type H+-transporting ATPase subunit gamma